MVDQMERDPLRRLSALADEAREMAVRGRVRAQLSREAVERAAQKIAQSRHAVQSLRETLSKVQSARRAPGGPSR
jgi:hypothetical protein